MEEPDLKNADKKRDTNFLFRAIIYALLIMGVLYAFEPYMPKSVPAPDKSAVTDLAADIGFTTSQDIGKWLQASKKPAVLMIYASWCNYCKLTMPNMKSLWNEKQFEGKQVLFVSIDSSPTKLATYLLSHDLLPMIKKPVIVRTGVAPSLPEILSPFGSSFSGGIPYMGFYAPGGKFVTELHGYVTKSSIKKSLHMLDTK